jgi:hypothetical protein
MTVSFLGVLFCNFTVRRASGRRESPQVTEFPPLRIAGLRKSWCFSPAATALITADPMLACAATDFDHRSDPLIDDSPEVKGALRGYVLIGVTGVHGGYVHTESGQAQGEVSGKMWAKPKLFRCRAAFEADTGLLSRIEIRLPLLGMRHAACGGLCWSRP